MAVTVKWLGDCDAVLELDDGSKVEVENLEGTFLVDGYDDDYIVLVANAGSDNETEYYFRMTFNGDDDIQGTFVEYEQELAAVKAAYEDIKF
ncbi:MAG: hypothetical protein LBK50_03955 [Candidatus Nomurabacteria bacterium]|jgi:hypothetical protein|nr:hypothetical protein [Candidatus Nomurabacteria bacterium]